MPTFTFQDYELLLELTTVADTHNNHRFCLIHNHGGERIESLPASPSNSPTEYRKGLLWLVTAREALCPLHVPVKDLLLLFFIYTNTANLPVAR